MNDNLSSDLQVAHTVHYDAGGAHAFVVVVLVDLLRHDGAGGHVKYWENIARVAASTKLDFRLEVHFQGALSSCEQWSADVYVYAHPPVFSSARIPGLAAMPDHCDLAKRQKCLLPHLRRANVVHCTDGLFTHAATARRYCAAHNIPLITSLHSDAVAYARVYTEVAVLELWPKISKLAWLNTLGKRVACSLAEHSAAHMQRRFERHLRMSDWIMQGAQATAMAVTGRAHSMMRRGIDRGVFFPSTSSVERAAYRQRMGIPVDAVVAAYSGRLSAGKRVTRIADTAVALRAQGHNVHVMFAGQGAAQAHLQARLGGAGHFLGQLSQTDVASMLRASDMLLFPSAIEVWPNAVVEARATGLAVLVDERGGGFLVERNGVDGLVVADNDMAWIDAALGLVASARMRERIGAAAYASSLLHAPDWEAVLATDLVPVWQRLAATQGLCAALRAQRMAELASGVN